MRKIFAVLFGLCLLAPAVMAASVNDIDKHAYIHHLKAMNGMRKHIFELMNKENKSAEEVAIYNDLVAKFDAKQAAWDEYLKAVATDDEEGRAKVENRQPGEGRHFGRHHHHHNNVRHHGCHCGKPNCPKAEVKCQKPCENKCVKAEAKCQKPCENKCVKAEVKCQKPCENKCVKAEAKCQKPCENKCVKAEAKCQKPCEKKCVKAEAKCQKPCENKCVKAEAKCQKPCENKCAQAHQHQQQHHHHHHHHHGERK